MKFQTALIITLLCWSCACFPQLGGSLSGYEKRWAIFHPFAALRIKKIYMKCVPLYSEVKAARQPDGFESGGRLDAFRHVFFMAAFSQKVKARKVRKLGQAHEKGNYKSFLKRQNEFGERPDSLSTVMDLQNNETGIDLGCTHKEASLSELKQLALEAIREGKAVYLKRNPSGQYIDCGGAPIDFENYKGKWFVPKCLVSTSQ